MRELIYTQDCEVRRTGKRTDKRMNANIPTSETLRGLDTSFRCKDFWDRVGGQTLLMIG